MAERVIDQNLRRDAGLDKSQATHNGLSKPVAPLSQNRSTSSGAPGKSPRIQALLPKSSGKSGPTQFDDRVTRFSFGFEKNNDPKVTAYRHDGAAALQTLIHELSQTLGLPLNKLDIRINGESEGVTQANNAQGLMHRGVVYLHPRFFDPTTTRGRYLLGHELAHLAQLHNRFHQPLADRKNAEQEAHDIGLRIAERRLPRQPQWSIDADRHYADTGVHAPGSEADSAEDEVLDLTALVRTRFYREIGRIRRLLGGLWISDGEVEEIMIILQGVQNFYAQMELIGLLNSEQKQDLLGNISASHRRRFRTEVLAVCAGMPGAILRRQDSGIFDGMDFARLSQEELLAIFHVKSNLPSEEWRSLVEDADAATQEQLREIERLGHSELSSEDLRRGQQEAARDIRDHAQVAVVAEGAVRDDPVLLALVREFKETLRDGASDEQKLGFLDALLPYMGEPEKIQGVARMLQPPYEDLLSRFLEDFPARQLYQGSETEDTHGDTRLAVFLRLVAARPPHDNILLAQELLEVTNFWFISINSVSQEEAYIAYQLIKVLPDDVRERFLATQIDGTTYGERMMAAMSQEMREAEGMNFYTGGEGGRDLAGIQGQILEDALWLPENRGRLRGLMSMAVEANQHRWLFGQSEMRYRTQRSDYMDPDFLREIVEPFMLYNPEAMQDGQAAPRTEYRPEYLRELRTRGVLSYLVDSGDFWGLAGSALFGHSIVGEHLNAVAFTEFMGGSFMGIRFTPHDLLGNEGERAVDNGRGVNFINRLVWDMRRGVMEMEARSLDIAEVRYRTGGVLIQAGHGTVRGLSLNLTFPVPGGNDRQEPAMDLRISDLTLSDTLVVLSSSVIGINELHITGLEVDIGDDAVRNQRAEPRTGFDPTTLFPLTPILRLIGLATSEIPERGQQLTEGLLYARDPAPIQLSLRHLELRGITLSGGQYVELLDIRNLHLNLSGSLEDYNEALFRSYLDLTHRVAELEVRIRREQPQGEALEQIQRQMARLNSQRETLRNLRREITDHSSERESLRAKRDDTPDQFTAANGRLLVELNDLLRPYEQGGLTLNVGRFHLSGVTGNVQLGELNLQNMHGHGTSAEGLAGLIPGTDTLLRIVRGESYVPPTVDGEIPREQADFALDMGDIDFTDFSMRSGIPELETVRDRLRELRNQLAERPWDPRRREAVAMAEYRLQQAQVYHRLAAIGVTYLTPQQLQEFRDARDFLTRDESLRIDSFHVADAELTFGQNGQQIGLRSSALSVRGVHLGESLTGAGAIDIAEIEGREVQIGAGFLGGVIGAGSNGTAGILQRLASAGISGEQLRISGIDQYLPGVSSGAPVTHVGEIRLEDHFDFSLAAQRGVLDASAGELIIENLRIQMTVDSLMQDIAAIEAKSEDRRSSTEIQRLDQLRQMLEMLRGFEQALQDLQAEIDSETDTERLLELRQQQQFLITAYDQWQVQLGAQSIEVSGLDARISGLGNVTAEGYRFEDVIRSGTGIRVEGRGDSTTERDAHGDFRRDRIFHSLDVHDGRFTGGAVSEIAVGETHGAASYSRTDIRLENFTVDSLSITNFSIMAGGHQLWSVGTSTLAGLRITASLHFEQDLEHPDEYRLREIQVNDFHITELVADQISYWSPDLNGQIDIQSGTVRGIWASDVLVHLPESESESDSLRIRGSAGIESISETRVTAYVEDRIQYAEATLNGTDMRVDFFESGESRFAVGDFSLTDGFIRTSAGFIRVSARHLSGAVTTNGTGFTFEDIYLEQLHLSRFAWTAGGREFRGDRPTVVRGIHVSGAVNTEVEDNPRITISHLHFDSIASEHFYYHEGDLTIEIRQPPAAPGSATTDAAQETGAASRARLPLEVVNVDIRDLDWSARAGVRPSEGSTRATVDVQSIHGAMDVLRGDLDLDVTVDTGALNLQFLRDGSQILNVHDINATASGTAMRGLEIDVSLTGANTGNITIDGREIDMPELSIPTAVVNDLHYDDDNYEVKIPDGTGSATLTGTRANVHVTMAESGSDLPFEQIVIRSLHVPRIESLGAQIRLKNAVPIGGGHHDLIISTSNTQSTVITDLRLHPLEEGGEGFVITPQLNASSEVEYRTAGRLGIGFLASRAAALEIPRFLNVHADTQVQTINVGFFEAGGTSLNIGQIDLTEIFGYYGEQQQHRFNAGTYDGLVRLPSREGHALPHTSPHHGPRVTISGFEREQDGSINIAGISAHGLVYENTDLGLRLQILDAVIPQDESEDEDMRVPGLRYDANTGRVTLREATVSNATFVINDLGALLTAPSSGSPSTMPAIDFWEFPDALNGVIEFSLSGQRWFVPDVVRRLHIEDGSISLDELQGYYSAAVSFILEGDRLSLILDRALVDALTTDPDNPYQERTPPIPIQTFEGLDESEQEVVRGGRVRISTLVRRRPESTGPATDAADYTHVSNLRGDLWVRGAPIIHIGDDGQLRIEGRNDPHHIDLHVDGTAPGQLNFKLTDLTASIVEGHPLVFNGVSLGSGSLEIEALHSVSLQISGFTAAGLGELRGSLSRATLSDLELTLPGSGGSTP